MAKYQGTGVITADDYKSVKWLGKTKSGKPITIFFEKAINMGNIDWSVADKDDTVAEIVMTAVYQNTDEAATDTKEPWTVEIDDNLPKGSGEILLGVGIFYINDVAIALTRGGGKFTVEREFREIVADGDRGPVEGRIVLDGSRASMTLKALTILNRFADLYPAVEPVTVTVTEEEETTK